MVSEDLLGQGRGGGGEGPAGGGVTGREGDRGPGGGFAQEGRNGRRGGPGRQDSAQRGGGQGDTAACQADAELLPRPGQPAAERPGRASEPPGGLVEGEALEVAEHHRQSEGARQAVDLAVDGLGLLAVDRRPVGRRGRRLGRDARARTGTAHRELSSRCRRRAICCRAHRAVRIATP